MSKRVNAKEKVKGRRGKGGENEEPEEEKG